MSNTLAFIGTYTRDDSVGIYVYNYNTETGELASVGSIESDNPSFLAIHPSGNFLYAINEISE
ncbi:MAG: beta-propeller fold lactonase family protein, partial [Candidatus Latescibacteria bacterium]|nr:beta-propeller fold lactonase family protein [Candidatus Latescibacterota bacterium]